MQNLVGSVKCAVVSAFWSLLWWYCWKYPHRGDGVAPFSDCVLRLSPVWVEVEEPVGSKAVCPGVTYRVECLCLALIIGIRSLLGMERKEYLLEPLKVTGRYYLDSLPPCSYPSPSLYFPTTNRPLDRASPIQPRRVKRWILPWGPFNVYAFSLLESKVKRVPLALDEFCPCELGVFLLVLSSDSRNEICRLMPGADPTSNNRRDEK